MRSLHENDFTMDNYEDFYKDHYFQVMTDEHALNAHRQLPRVAWAVDVAKELQPKSVLDLGCLEGFTVLTLANKVPSIKRGIGVDLSSDGVELANNRRHLVGAELDFYQMSIEEFLEKTDEKFDLICMFEVIEHVKDPEYILKLIDKVKTKDGQVLISTPDFEGPVFGKDDEKNKCHIRLYSMSDEDYEAVNRFGNTRKATSMSKQIGKNRIISMGVYSHLINVRYS